MTYSLHTLNADTIDEVPVPAGWVRFASEIVLFLGFFILVFLLLAFASYSVHDAAWTTSGAGGAIANRGGRLGASMADMGYFLFGYSVWWCLALAAMAWGRLALRRFQGQYGPRQPARIDHASPLWDRNPQVVMAVGLGLLLAASTTLEYTRLYRLDQYLPGSSGGVLGYVLGTRAVLLLGFVGSGLLAIGAGLMRAGNRFRSGALWRRTWNWASRLCVSAKFHCIPTDRLWIRLALALQQATMHRKSPL